MCTLVKITGKSEPSELPDQTELECWGTENERKNGGKTGEKQEWKRKRSGGDPCVENSKVFSFYSRFSHSSRWSYDVPSEYTSLGAE